jgi:hypothetical protein
LGAGPRMPVAHGPFTPNPNVDPSEDKDYAVPRD